MAAVDSVVTIEAQPALWNLLCELAEEQRRCREYLGRLVALEEGRRAGEQQMEALATSLMPSNAESKQAADLDWYRSVDGSYLERHTDRRLTREEIEIVTYSPRREARRSR